MSPYRNHSSKKKPARRKPPAPAGTAPARAPAPAVTGRTDDPIHNKEWRMLVRWTLRSQGTVCHLCNHGGADSADHVIPRAEDPGKTYDASNLRPVHHKPCPACGIRCNMVRGSLSVTAARNKVKRIQQQRGTEPEVTAPAEDGRPW